MPGVNRKEKISLEEIITAKTIFQDSLLKDETIYINFLGEEVKKLPDVFKKYGYELMRKRLECYKHITEVIQKQNEYLDIFLRDIEGGES